MNLYAWQSHLAAIREIPVFRTFQVRAVTSAREMKGVGNGAFFITCAFHAKALPVDIAEEVQVQGMTIITIDDSPARARKLNETRHKERAQ